MLFQSHHLVTGSTSIILFLNSKFLMQYFILKRFWSRSNPNLTMLFMYYTTSAFACVVLVAPVGTSMLSLTRHLFICMPILRWHIEEAPQSLCPIAVTPWLLRMDIARIFVPTYFPGDGEIMKRKADQKTGDSHLSLFLKLLEWWSLNIYGNYLRWCRRYWKKNMTLKWQKMPQEIMMRKSVSQMLNGWFRNSVNVLFLHLMQ